MSQENAAEFYKIISGIAKTNSKLCIWYFPAHDNQGNNQAVGSEQTENKSFLSQMYLCVNLFEVKM